MSIAQHKSKIQQWNPTENIR